MSSQQLSDEEFHRLQLQIIEMRTENYQLKDENKKYTHQLKELSEREAKLERELNKQVKMKKALSTLNKSKQVQEYEALLLQTEQEFALQSQTLKTELSKLVLTVDKLETENQQLKKGYTRTNESDADFRRLQAENIALKNRIETMEAKHADDLDDFAKLQHSVETNHQPVMTESDSLPPSTDEFDISDSVHSPDGESIPDEKFLHLQAKCERLKSQLKEFDGVKLNLSIIKEEKTFLEKALDEERSRHAREHRALENEIEAFREKLEQKQTTCIQLQEEKEKLYNQVKSNSSEASLTQEKILFEKDENEKKYRNEISSLGNALQSAHILIEKHQSNTDNIQTTIASLENERTEILKENNKLKNDLQNLIQKEKNREQEKQNRNSTNKSLDDQIKSLKSTLDRVRMERDDAVTKFEESARASGALLLHNSELEQANENLQRELTDAQELAEKRKKVVDKQAVESQEVSARFSEQINKMKEEHESSYKKSKDAYHEKIKILESTCKKQEQELIRINHQDRAKTRELDALQQEARDLHATVTSLESSRGWFERALQDAEEAAHRKDEDHQKQLDQMVADCEKEIEKIKVELAAKDDVIESCRLEVDEAKKDAASRDHTIEKLKQDIEDEKSKQKLIEKKGQASMKDLKRQLTSENKRNEKLQEKLKELSTSTTHSNLDELLHSRDDKDGDASSVSSFSFRDFLGSKSNANDGSSQAGSAGGHSSKKFSHAPHSPNINKTETVELLSRITKLQQDKWRLEEQVMHLEESAGGMAEELLEKTKLLQEYVQRTRSDPHKFKSSNEELASSSRNLGGRLKNIITGQQDNDVDNILELNRKLTRMLEEEMTKNKALQNNLAILSRQIPAVD